MFRAFTTFSILLLLFYSNFIESFSQTIPGFEQFNMEDGLIGNTIYTIFQDSRGFLWFGTLGGLSRYDGYEFKNYSNDPLNERSLSNNVVNSIYEDSSGVLWVGTFKGLNRYNRETDDFQVLLSDPDNDSSLSSNIVMGIYQDKEGIIWIGTDGGGLNKFNRETETFVHFKHNPKDSTSISHNSIYYGIIETTSGEFWIGTYGGGLNRFFKKTGKFVNYRHNQAELSSLSDDKIFTIYEDNSGTIWIGTDGGGLNQLIHGNDNPNYPSFISYKHNPLDPKTISGDRVFSIFEDSMGYFWVATYNGGLDKFNKTNHQFERISANSTRSIYQDKSELLWFGTDLGVYKLNRQKLRFKHYKHNSDNPKGFKGITVFPFLEYDNNTIWIGTGGWGLNKFIRDQYVFINYKNDPNRLKSISHNSILCLFKDESNIIWIGTWGGGINKLLPSEMNKAYPSFIQIKNNPEHLKTIGGNIVVSIMEDSAGQIWIGTEDGGISILPKNERNKSNPSFINYKHDPNNPNSLIDNRVYYIYEDSKYDIWIATIKGLEKFDKSRNGFIHFNHDPNDPNSLSSDDITTIFEDDTDVLWIGTTAGLNKFIREENRFIVYTEKDGLADNIIWGILEDDHGNLWITNEGLTKFDPGSETFKNYSAIDGLQSNEFDQNSCLKLTSGEMLIGGTNGFNLFHPDSIKDNKYIPPVLITDFQLDNKTVPIGFDSTLGRLILDKPIEETKQIELFYYDNVISFEFTALDFYAPERNQYAYMMEGFENDWKYTDALRRYVTYTNLDPGDYIFRVKGSNNDGYWNEEGASIKIIILPPWWQTTWAYLIYALIILSIVYFTWKLQLKRIRIKHDYEMSKFEAEKMHEVDEMKSRFFANISHEFRTPLTLIFGPAKDVIEKSKEPETKKNVSLIKRNAIRLYGLVNQLLDISKLEAGKMKLEASEQDIISLLKGIFLSFSSLAERKKITLNFNTIEQNLNVYIDRDKVEKIINNLLSNAFKFTPEGGNIDFTVEKMIEDVEIRITDNGIGIPEERIHKIFDRFYQVDSSHTRQGEGTGIGLALTKELVELHKGKIKVESKEGEGTTVTVWLLLGKDHLKPEEIVKKQAEEVIPETQEKPEQVIDSENRKAKTDTDVLADTENPLLLIVEDNSDVRSYIISHLEEDYRIREAVDGEDGLGQALQHIPDLIISDVMMPKIDGFELCNKLKTDKKTSHIPIIMLTAKATGKDKIEGYETGADDYIMKPFDAAELKARIKNLIEIRRKLQKKFSSDEFKIPKEFNPVDEQFMKKVLQVIYRHLSEEEFSIEELGKESAMSRAQIYNKIKALTGKSPSLFLRSVRLTKAKKMIKVHAGTISEIAYSVGFSSPAYFTKCFREEFGYPPSDLANS